MVVYYKLVHAEPEYRSQMLARADGTWAKRADYEAAQAEIALDSVIGACYGGERIRRQMK